jgi:hypothetical protein
MVSIETEDTMATPTDAVRELGRRALIPAYRNEARAILREVANNPDVPAKRRKLAADLLAKSSTLAELRADMKVTQ